MIRCLFVALWPIVALTAAVEKEQINLEYVVKLAEERARKPFRSPRIDLPEALRPEKLNYDGYRKIRFRQDRALWSSEKLPFHVEFYHPGYIYAEPVRVFEFTRTHVQRIRFVRDFFDYSDLDVQRHIPADTGYAGFKVAAALGKPGEFPEVVSFLGASYFRMVGRGLQFGLSGRGLTLDCGETDRPEEFPIFTDFWLGKPAPDVSELRLYALLDSVSCTGAYEFAIRPGDTTVADIDAVIFFREQDKALAANKDRKPLATIGLAPLTSMFWFGKNSECKPDDYRTEVHDSDGLLIQTVSGENIWHPLSNPPVLRHSVVPATNVRGFGLLQRDRDFKSYHDIARPYHLVTSAWIQPGKWGDGDLHLLELPTKGEGLDNIVAFWNPREKPPPMQPFRFNYRQLWTADPGISEDRVVATRVGAQENRREVHIDFAGPKLDALGPNDPPNAVATCSDNATHFEANVMHSPFERTWHVVLRFEPRPNDLQPVELRCTLKHGEETITETWNYHWSPP